MDQAQIHTQRQQQILVHRVPYYLYHEHGEASSLTAQLGRGRRLEDHEQVAFEDEQVCMIYDKNDFFTVFVQLLLAFFALASLWYKRLTEVPRRNFRTWFLDVSKQALGAGYAHVLNMIIAAIISQNVRGTSGDNLDGTVSYSLDDQCAWYGISYLVDVSLGLLLAIILLHWLHVAANHFNWSHLKDSGVYDGPSAYSHWFVQCLAWIIILTVVKLLCYFVIWLFSQPLAMLGSLLFAPLQGSIKFELLFVMILFPGCMNGTYRRGQIGKAPAVADSL
jgi:STIMATE family